MHCLLHRRSGFLMVEVLLGIAVFALFMTAIGLTLFNGQESSIVGGDWVRGAFFAERSLEGVRSIRDGNFSSLTTGQHGVALQSGTWALSGSEVNTGSGYHTNVVITSLASDWKQVVATTKWKNGYNRSGSIILTTELTDWRSTGHIGDWSSVTPESNTAPGGNPLFNNLAVSGNYAFITSDTSGGGAGLYVYDISDTAAPVRVAGSFTLGASGYGVAVRGGTLYVITGDSSQEIRAYSITSPTTLSSANLRISYNLPGSALGKSLGLNGRYLYVGAAASAVAGEKELYSFDVINSGAIVLKSSVDDDSSTVNAVSLTGTSAYLASSMDTSELRVFSVSITGAIILAGGYNLSDRTLDGLMIATVGTSALLGTQKGSSIQEAVLFDLENGGVPDPPPGPWYHEASGSVVGLAIDPTVCYGFIAASSGRKAFQVMNIRDKSLPELTSYNSATGLARGLTYDPIRDRVYLLTDTAFLIFKPTTTPSPCT